MPGLRLLKPLALACTLPLPLLAGPLLCGEASAQIRLKQTFTHSPEISASERRRMEADARLREQRARERREEQRRFSEYARRVQEEQRTKRTILFGGGKSSPNHRPVGGATR